MGTKPHFLPQTLGLDSQVRWRFRPSHVQFTRNQGRNSILGKSNYSTLIRIVWKICRSMNPEQQAAPLGILTVLCFFPDFGSLLWPSVRPGSLCLYGNRHA
jgi:hypothetical protein